MAESETKPVPGVEKDLEQPKLPDKGGHAVKLALSDEIGRGHYCNFTLITHTFAEFIMDFAQLLPGLRDSPVRTRVIMAPVHLKALAMALNQNVQKYEQTFGEIAMGGTNWDAINKVVQNMGPPGDA